MKEAEVRDRSIVSHPTTNRTTKPPTEDGGGERVEVKLRDTLTHGGGFVSHVRTVLCVWLDPTSG